MLSQPIFDDRSLAESFYRSLMKRFCESVGRETQTLLSECHLGIAPSPAGEPTFFIVAPSVEVADQLIEDIDSILKQVVNIMAGVEQTAICVTPPHIESDCTEFPPKFMLGKIFSNLPECEPLD